MSSTANANDNENDNVPVAWFARDWEGVQNELRATGRPALADAIWTLISAIPYEEMVVIELAPGDAALCERIYAAFPGVGSVGGEGGAGL